MKGVLKNELRQLMQAAPPLPDAAKKAQLMEQARSKRLSLSTETSMLQFIKGCRPSLSKDTRYLLSLHSTGLKDPVLQSPLPSGRCSPCCLHESVQ